MLKKSYLSKNTYVLYNSVPKNLGTIACINSMYSCFFLILQSSSTGDYLDILAVSCDSFYEETNKVIGRSQGRKSHLDNLHKVRNWCREYKVAFKINSVINTYNVDEDMRENISALNPVRWKVRLFTVQI